MDDLFDIPTNYSSEERQKIISDMLHNGTATDRDIEHIGIPLFQNVYKKVFPNCRIFDTRAQDPNSKLDSILYGINLESVFLNTCFSEEKCRRPFILDIFLRKGTLAIEKIGFLEKNILGSSILNCDADLFSYAILNQYGSDFSFWCMCKTKDLIRLVKTNDYDDSCLGQTNHNRHTPNYLVPWKTDLKPICFAHKEGF